MTEQEQIVQDFKDQCEEIIAKHGATTTEQPASTASVLNEITELADDTLNRHSNLPNIDAEQLKEDLDSAAKNYFHISRANS